MPCNCDSRLDSIMKFLEEVRTEIGFVKTKCIRIEKEILGITAESEMNAEALMETTTVRHLVEKMAYDVTVLTEESSKARAEAKRLREMEAASKDLHSKFSEATLEKIKDIKLKYDVLTLKTFQTEFSSFLKDFRSHTEKALLMRGFSNSVIHDVVEGVARATDLDDLYGIHFLEKYEEMGSFVREQYDGVIETYAANAIEIERMEDFHEIGQTLSTEFLNSFKLCEGSFPIFQEELRSEFRQINEQIEANRGLLVRLTREYRQYFNRTQQETVFDGELPAYLKKLELETMLRQEITITDAKQIQMYVQKLRQNITDISNPSAGRPWKFSFITHSF